MPQFSQLTELANQFRGAREWRQFHKPKDFAIGMMQTSAAGT